VEAADVVAMGLWRDVPVSGQALRGANLTGAILGARVRPGEAKAIGVNLTHAELAGAHRRRPLG